MCVVMTKAPLLYQVPRPWVWAAKSTLTHAPPACNLLRDSDGPDHVRHAAIDSAAIMKKHHCLKDASIHRRPWGDTPSEILLPCCAPLRHRPSSRPRASHLPWRNPLRHPQVHHLPLPPHPLLSQVRRRIPHRPPLPPPPAPNLARPG